MGLCCARRALRSKWIAPRVLKNVGEPLPSTLLRTVSLSNRVGSRGAGEMQEQLKEIYELNNSLLQLAENLQDEFSKRKIKRDTLTADLSLLCFFFAKASKTASVVVLLCQNGCYAEDALVLVRTIFEIVVRSSYIFKSDSINRARDYILYDNFEIRKQLRKVTKWHKKNNVENREVEEELENVETDCETLEKDLQINRDNVIWPKKKLEELSIKEVDLGNIYYTFYWISSLYCHTSMRSSKSYVSESEEGISFDIKPNQQLAKDVLIWLFDLFRLMAREFDNRFNLGYREKISEVEEEFNKFMQSAMNGK